MPGRVIEDIADATYDFYSQVAYGLVKDTKLVNKMGVNPDIDSNTTPEDIWNGGSVYTGFPDHSVAPDTVNVVSSSANDTAAGSGARTITMYGLDADYNEQEETLTLNGLTPVTSTKTWRRINLCNVITAGSSTASNAGTLTCSYTNTPATVFFAMPVGNNHTNVAGYTIPAGYTGLVQRIRGIIHGASGASGFADGVMYARDFQGVFRSRRPFTMTTGFIYEDIIDGGLVLTEKSDIIPRVTIASTSNLFTTVRYTILLRKND